MIDNDEYQQKLGSRATSSRVTFTSERSPGRNTRGTFYVTYFASSKRLFSSDFKLESNLYQDFC